MNFWKLPVLILSVVALSATASAHNTSTVKDMIENCSSMGDFCSGFVTGAYMLAPSSGELGVCWPDDDRHSLRTTDSMLADWMTNQVSKGHLSSKDDGYVTLTIGMRSLFPCKKGGK
jgi:hypothetical protein